VKKLVEVELGYLLYTRLIMLREALDSGHTHFIPVLTKLLVSKCELCGALPSHNR
jgi:hypothetical protein